MFGRSGWCLLAGMLLAPGIVAGQVKNHGPAMRLAAPHAFVVEPRPVPPVRRPLPPIIISPSRFGLPQLVQAAGMIFSGTVTRIERRAAVPGQIVETVAITFHVENSIRGAARGRDLTITQWIGLWSFGQKYRVGERAVLFLYPKSRLGLTSCVGGELGRLAVDSSGSVVLTALQATAFRRDSVIGGKSRLPFSDFALAVRRSGEEE